MTLPPVLSPARVGVDIGGTKLLLLAEREGADKPLTGCTATGPDAHPGDIEVAVKRFLTENALAPTSLGIAVPGLVENGQVTICDVLPSLNGWRGLPGNGVHHLLVNDIRGALAHETVGFDDTSTVAVVLSGTAIGSAYLHQGRVVRGSRGWAGEIGSMPVPTPEGVFRLDELAGGAAIVKAAGHTPAQVHAALATGDLSVRSVIDAAGEMFGLAIATLVNILNPDVIRVAGGTLGYPGYWDTALATARAHSLPELWQVCTVEQIRDPDLVVARGALGLAAASASGETWPLQYI